MGPGVGRSGGFGGRVVSWGCGLWVGWGGVWSLGGVGEGGRGDQQFDDAVAVGVHVHLLEPLLQIHKRLLPRHVVH